MRHGGAMAKQIINKLTTEYLVIKCATPDGPKGLGIIGRVNLPRQAGMFFFVGNSPKSIKGLDPFEMKIVAAVPETVRNDLRYFISEKISPEKMLNELSSRYRGTISASERVAANLSVTITDATTPEKLISRFTSAIMQLAIKEKIVSPPQSKGWHKGTKAAYIKSTMRRRYKFPSQFELMDARAHA
jgi:hypothetical protein